MKMLLNNYSSSIRTSPARAPASRALKTEVPLHLSHGFTLIELMTTVGIAMILLTIAAPNFSTMISNNTLTAQANDLFANLALARSQAKSRKQMVTVCKSNDADACSTLDTVNWEDGWVMFVDENQNGTRQDAELILRTSEGLTNATTLRADVDFSNYIAFRSDGRSIGSGSSTPPTEGDFRLCDARGAEHARVVAISPIGRAKVPPLPPADKDPLVDACP